MPLPDILPFARQLLRGCLKDGDIAADATMGNGHDTLFLAECVGARGRVFAFDVQNAALAATDRRLRDAGLRQRAVLCAIGHEQMQGYVPQGIQAAVFNFGYLPGGGKHLTTLPHTSLRGFQAALNLLADGGLLVAVLYPGHPAGAQEARLLPQFAESLPPQRFSVVRYGFCNRPNRPPFVLAVHKHPTPR